jgi:hypothetical protein
MAQVVQHLLDKFKDSEFTLQYCKRKKKSLVSDRNGQEVVIKKEEYI